MYSEPFPVVLFYSLKFEEAENMDLGQKQSLPDETFIYRPRYRVT